MQYWYPTQARVQALGKELSALERLGASHATDAPEQVSAISAQLAAATRRKDFPAHQLGRWLWLGSQYRVHAASGGIVGLKSAAALHFLSKRLEVDPLTTSDHQDLNWVLDSTIRELSQVVSAHDLRSCLTTDELERVEHRLAELSHKGDFEIEYVRSRVSAQLDTLKAFSHLSELADIQEKVEALFAAAERQDDDAQIAKAALLYLAEERDVVDDNDGVLGLIDDLYVIEWAYAAVESQTRCLPILDGLLQRWPFVADLAVLDGGQSSLNRFSQYVACAILHSLFSDSPRRALLVVRETGGYPLIGALMAAIECSRGQEAAPSSDIARWPIGQPITISDGVKSFKATFDGATDVMGQRRYKIGVRNSGTLFVGDGTLRYVARAARPHAQLASGNEISAWLNERHIDPLINLNGVGRRQSSNHDAVLLLGPRHKLDDLLGCLAPQGVSMQALLGLKYVNAHQEMADVKGSAADQPFAYACSDPAVAIELLRDRPAHVRSWRVIVDGARLARSFLGAVASSSDLSSTPICAMVDLFEREASADVIKLGVQRIWYLEDQDVEAPVRASSVAVAGSDLLGLMLARRSAHWASIQTITSISHPFLENTASCLRDRPRDEAHVSDSAILDLSVSTFIQKALASVLPSEASMAELRRLGSSIRSHASLLRQYDPVAAKLYGYFQDAPLDDGLFAARREAISALARGGGRTAVVCRSAHIAEECREHARRDPSLRTLEWMNIEQLRHEDPFDRVIVPAWLDRLSMRELALNGYAPRLEFVMLPFERTWFETTTAAVRRWERSLEAKTAACLADTAKTLGQSSKLAQAWRKQTSLRLQLDPAPQPEDERDWNDEPDTEHLEARAIEAIMRRASASGTSEPDARAQLVLFEEPGAYIFLPPQGRVIVLSETRRQTSQNAERMLMRSVAELKPGMVVALPAGGDRDLIDARADQFIDGPGRVRRDAGLWKAALKRFLDDSDEKMRALAKKMSERGQSRDPATIRYWVHYDYTTAPRNYREVIPLISQLTGDPELGARLSECLQGVDLIYRARAKAAQAIVDELFSGEIDITQPALTFDLDGRAVSYDLHRVRRLGELETVPTKVIGKIGRIGATAAQGTLW